MICPLNFRRQAQKKTSHLESAAHSVLTLARPHARTHARTHAGNLHSPAIALLTPSFALFVY